MKEGNLFFIASAHSRFYSSGSNKNNISYTSLRKDSNNLSKILHSLYTNNTNNFMSNERNQMAIEEFVFDQYVTLFNNKKSFRLGDIDVSLIGGRLKQFIMDKEDILFTRVNDFKEFYLKSESGTRDYISN